MKRNWLFLLMPKISLSPLEKSDLKARKGNYIFSYTFSTYEKIIKKYVWNNNNNNNNNQDNASS